MPANISRARTSRRSATTTSGLGRGLAVAALIGGLAGVGFLGFAAAVNPVHAAPGNNGTVKIAEYDADNTLITNANDPHVSCTFDVRWFGFDANQDTATVDFSAQSPTGAGDFTITGQTAGIQFTGGTGGGNTFDHQEQYTLVPAAGVTDTSFHVKVQVETTWSGGSSISKFKAFWVDGCAAPVSATSTTTTTIPATTTTLPTTPTTSTTTAATTTTATTTTTTTAATSAVVPPPQGAGGGPASAATQGVEATQATATPAAATPAPQGASTQQAVPTRIESGLATLPSADQDQNGSSSRWLLLTISGISALLGAIGLRPRRGVGR